MSNLSGIRFILPVLFSVGIFLLIDIIELISPFYAGDSWAYYQLMLVYFFSGFFLVTPFFTTQYKKFDFNFSALSASRVIKYTSILSFVGVLFVILDRIYIQGVDYSHGISNAREEWRNGAVSRGGVSSIFSVLGNLLYPLIYASYILIIIFYEDIKNSFKELIFVIFVVVIFSLIIGGRTEVLVLTGLFISTTVIRVLLGKKFMPRRLSGRIFILLGGLLFFVGFVFYLRMGNSNVSMDFYISSLLSRHEGRLAVGARIDSLTPIEAVMDAVVIYIVHVKWIFQDILNNSQNLFGNSSLNQFFSILSSRAGVDLSYFGYDEIWTHHGRWISFPGSVWHDFGWVGVIIISNVMYLIFAIFNFTLVKIKYLKKNLQLVFLIWYAIFIAIFIMSAFASLLSVVSFIYLCLMSAFIMVLIVLLDLTVGRRVVV